MSLLYRWLNVARAAPRLDCKRLAGRFSNGLVEGAPNRDAAAFQDVGVDHGRGHFAVAEELLDGPDVIAAFEEMGRERGGRE